MANKKVVLTLGGKGGTGKTLFCRTLFHLLNGENINVTGFDVDRENPEFWDYHQTDTNPVQRLNFLSIDGARQFISRLEQDHPQVALLDLPGASGAATREQFIRFDIFSTLKQELDGYEVTIAAVLNDCFNSIGSLGAMMDAFGTQASYVAVLSEFWSHGERPFKRWKGSERFGEFTNLQGKEVVMPVLESEVFDVIHGQGLPFSKMNELGLGDRILLRSYLNRCRASFDPAADYLGLPALDGRNPAELVAQSVAVSQTAKTRKKKATAEAT